MSDNAVFVICMTVFMLEMLIFAGFVAWLNSRNPSTGHRRPPTLLPPGHWGTYQPLPKGGITPKETPQGHQPTDTVNTANPPQGGSAVTPRIQPDPRLDAYAPPYGASHPNFRSEGDES
jgi:hypothetical protein